MTALTESALDVNLTDMVDQWTQQLFSKLKRFASLPIPFHPIADESAGLWLIALFAVNLFLCCFCAQVEMEAWIFSL